MTDETDKKDSSEESPIGGERLRSARRNNDISIRDVAKELHLDEHKVRALEKNEFDALGAPVFAKGHLRKYAEMVGVPVDDIMSDYYQMNRAAGAPPVVGPVKKHPREGNAAPWIGLAVIAALIAAILYWWFAVRPVSPVIVADPTEPAPFASTQTAEPPPVEQTVDGAESTQTESAPTETGPVEDEQYEVIQSEPIAPASDLVTNAPQVDVAIAYTGDCWTEVSDANGRRLFYDMGTEGRTVSLSGHEPLRVILGNSENVSITVDGRPWPIPASARTGRLARLTISSQ